MGGWRGVLAAGMLTVFLVGTSPAGIQRVWAVNDGEKVNMDDTKSPLAAGNSAWDTATVGVFGARNEIVAFQVIIEPDKKGATLEEVDFRGLSGPGGFEISNEGFSKGNDYMGRRIEIFTQHYVNLFDCTSAEQDRFWSEEARPWNRCGWVPDALVPLDAVMFKGGLPAQIPAGQNCGLWFDVYIPADAPAGKYKGTIALSFGRYSKAEVPVELEVLDFQLPNETHFTTMAYYQKNALRERYGLVRGMELAFRQMAHRHRFTLITGDMTVVDRVGLEHYFDGEYYSGAYGYAGPCEGVGDGIFCLGPCGEPVLGTTQEKIEEQSDLWVTWLDKIAPGVLYFLFVADGPGPKDLAWVKQRTSWVKDNPGPGRTLKILATATPTEDLEGAIDIWLGKPKEITPQMVEEQHAMGRLVGIYNGYRPSSGAVVTDEAAIAFRTFPWIARRYGLDMYFCWCVNNWQSVNIGTGTESLLNVYEKAVTLADGARVLSNGDGILFYPGRDFVCPKEDRGIDGPISSIRMKNLRRGMQDYEYMYLAAQKGKGREADAVVRKMIPAALSEATGKVAWSEEGNTWDEARRELATLIVASAEAEQSTEPQPSREARNAP